MTYLAADSGGSSDVITLFGTIMAALLALGAAIYTARSSRKASEVTASQAADAVDRESQRQTQMAMLDLLRKEVEALNVRVVELRTRLISAEDQTDRERKLRRDVENKVDELQESLGRMARILTQVAPEVRTTHPDLFPPNQPLI